MAASRNPIADSEEPINEVENVANQSVSLKLKRWQWWLLVVLNIFFLVAGQSVAVVVGRYYYEQGGKSNWLATLLQTIGFPILYIPLLLLPSPQEPSSSSSSPPFVILASIYLFLGVLLAGDNMLYSIGLLYLPASTYALICATQLAWNAVFAYFLNSQKFTPFILNSVVILTLSASLVAINEQSKEPSGVSKWKYIIGVICTLGASAIYSFMLSLMQLAFVTVLKRQTFGVVLDMQIYTSVIATCVCIVGLFASGEWNTLAGEMQAFSKGKVSYVMVVVWLAIAWQVCSVGVVGLIYLVSSLFSNVISTVSLAITPIVSVIFLHDNVNGVKVIALLLSIWGFASYFYQNYVDDSNARSARRSQYDVSETDSGPECH